MLPGIAFVFCIFLNVSRYLPFVAFTAAWTRNICCQRVANTPISHRTFFTAIFYFTFAKSVLQPGQCGIILSVQLFALQFTVRWLSRFIEASVTDVRHF